MTATQEAALRPQEAMRCIARRLAEAIDHAVDGGMFAQADRLAGHARRLAIHSTRLAERIARLRLAQDDPEAAMSMIDACTEQSASMRLLRIACLVQLGRTAEAHLQLQEWSTRSTAPLAARRMLALLDAAVGDHADASTMLTRNLQHVEDPSTLELLTILCAAEGRSEQSRHWADRLRQASIITRGTVDVELLCESLDLPCESDAEPIVPSSTQIAMLAMELAASAPSLAALVQQQERELQPAVAELLYCATEQAIEELDEPTVGYEALTRLALLLSRTDAAGEWIRRGLEANPMSASLALLQTQLRESQAVETSTNERKAA